MNPGLQYPRAASSPSYVPHFIQSSTFTNIPKLAELFDSDPNSEDRPIHPLTLETTPTPSHSQSSSVSHGAPPSESIALLELVRITPSGGPRIPNSHKRSWNETSPNDARGIPNAHADVDHHQKAPPAKRLRVANVNASSTTPTCASGNPSHQAPIPQPRSPQATQRRLATTYSSPSSSSSPAIQHQSNKHTNTVINTWAALTRETPNFRFGAYLSTFATFCDVIQNDPAFQSPSGDLFFNVDSVMEEIIQSEPLRQNGRSHTSEFIDYAATFRDFLTSTYKDAISRETCAKILCIRAKSLRSWNSPTETQALTLKDRITFQLRALLYFKCVIPNPHYDIHHRKKILPLITKLQDDCVRDIKEYLNSKQSVSIDYYLSDGAESNASDSASSNAQLHPLRIP